MANYSTTANVVLSVNGKQAQQMLRNLERDAKRLEQQIAKAAKAGDKATMKKLQRELTQTNKLVQQLKGSSATAEQVLRRLDKATPKELNKTLRTLQQQLNGIQRGSAAWDAQVAKIRAVKAELQKVNATLATQKTMWQRMNIWLNNCQTAIMGLAAAVTGLIMAGRKAVNAYAQMDEQIANSVKYTRMSRDEVEKLQEAFMQMDTRTSREQLNLLAQEAGRLGKNTMESVLGYVEAADILNVALVDLGAGATQTIAKLTNIFGVEQMLGTKEAMLAVGSTVNHLSQNCTASKPYLVEFAQRMAGIGATAGMTIPEILAFGAVLDANGQKVEMSATAIQKVIMNLANKSKSFANTLGMDADVLNQTLKRSAKDGLLMFLDRLHEIGEATDYTNATMTLAPAFKDMGLDAARVSQVLSTLAKHVDEVKWQLGEAEGAFNAATSATNEFAIFNNTAQASIDKAKKRVSELAIELGQKLYPVMKHIYTSSGVFLRVLNQIVTFLINNRTAIVQITAVWLAYKIAVNASNIAFKVHYAWIVITEKATALLKGTILICRMAYYALTGQIGKATAAQRLYNTVFKSTPWGAITAAVVALGIAIYNMATRTTAAEKATAEFEKKMQDATAKAHGFNEEMLKEQHELDVLFGKLDAAKKGTAEYETVKNQIIKQYGKYLTGLVDEKGEINNLTAAYVRLAKAIRRAAEERGIAAAREQIDNDYFSDLSNNLDTLQATLERYGADARTASRLVQSVATAMAAGKPIPDDVVREINSYAANTPSGMGYAATMQYRAQNTAGFAGWLNQGIADLFTFGGGKGEVPVNPAALVNTMFTRREQRDRALANVDAMHDGVNPMRKVNDTELQWAIESLQMIVDSGRGGSALIHDSGNVFSYEEVTLDRARQLLSEYLDEKAIRAGGTRQNTGDYSDLDVDFSDPSPTDLGLNLGETPEEKRERLAREKAQRDAEKAAKQALKEDLKEQKRLRDEALAENERQRNEDLISESEYLNRKDKIQLDFLAESKKVLEQRGLQETAEYAALVRQEEEIATKALQRMQKGELTDLKNQYTQDTTANNTAYHNGDIDYATYIAKKEQLDINYLNARIAVYRNYNRTDTQEYADLLKQQEEMLEQHLERQRELRRRDIDLEHRDKLSNIEMQYYTPGSDSFLDDTKHEQEVFDELIRYLTAKRDTYLKGSQEWQRLDDQITEATQQRATDKQRQYAEAYKSLMAQELKQSEYKQQLAMLDSVYKHELELAEGNEERKNALIRAYHLARVALAKQYGVVEGNAMQKAIAKTARWLESDGGEALKGALNTLSQGLSDIFSGVTSLMQADLEIQTEAINKRYDAEISRAEGNSYQVKKLEQQKQAELAKAKNEANRKMFAMQVIQAVAQTATNALSAYGSAAAVPVIGYILAPIAAAMAVAAGAIQIAAIKKQQQASEAQGYSEGGFTPEGAKDTAVGVVHAGEWVASQKLTHDPKTRPLLEALDNAQRNNTIGSLTHDAVAALMPTNVGSITVSAGATQEAIRQTPPPTVNVTAPQSGSGNKELTETLSLLRDRLNEPIGAVVTVSGDQGIARAQDEYDNLMRNKSPKSKK